MIPGLLEYKSAKIQLLDVPGVIQGAAEGSGRGKEVISTIQMADLLIIMVDVNNLHQLATIKSELYKANIRITQKKPGITIKKTERGGIEIAANESHLAKETITAILKEYRMSNAYASISQDITEDELIDALEGNRKYVPAITVINKADLASKEALKAAREKMPDALIMSAEKNKGIGALKEGIFRKLGLVRIFLKQVGKKADLEEPVIMKEGCSVKDVCIKLHRDFVNRFRFARVWGESAKFPGQRFNLEHRLKNEDVVQIHLR